MDPTIKNRQIIWVDERKDSFQTEVFIFLTQNMDKYVKHFIKMILMEQ